MSAFRLVEKNRMRMSRDDIPAEAPLSAEKPPIRPAPVKSPILKPVAPVVSNAAPAPSAKPTPVVKKTPTPTPKATVKKPAPVAKKATVACNKGSQKRVFEGTKCPSGWKK